MTSLSRLAFAPLAALVLAAPPAFAQLPNLASELVVGGFDAPVHLAFAPGDSQRMFVAQQGGLVVVVQNGAINPTPFLDLTAKSSQVGGERGLLGFTFDPNYESNGFFYVGYTQIVGHASVVERYSVSANPNVADPTSGTTILGPVSEPFATHNIGHLEFGPDDKLYVGMGDGGAAGDPGCRAQDGQSLHGKILRINRDGSIPGDNPFVGDAAFLDEIWAYGVRNPWRFGFDSATGDLWIGDVGQADREEVNFQPASSTGGENYGWKIMEGLTCFGTDACSPGVPACNDPSLTLPLFEYDHSVGCSVTGGRVYRGCAIPGLVGNYVYADFCGGNAFVFDGSTSTNIKDDIKPASGAITTIVTIAEDHDGELYFVERGFSGPGEIWKIVPDPDATLIGTPASLSVAAGGAQSLDINAGACLGGSAYLVLGSASGTVPGVPFGGFVVPLNFDAYLNFTLSNANVPPFVGTFGFLDGSGAATAQIVVTPAAVPSLVGQTLNHAGVVISLTSFDIELVTAAAPLQFLP